MSKIISMNVESLSLKFRLFEMPNEEVLISGIIEKVGFEDAISTIKVNGEKTKKVLPIPGHTKTVSIPLEALVEHRIVNSLNEITDTGHHVVYGGEIFKESVLIMEDVVERFASLNDLVPLRNPASLIGYNAFKNNLPNCKHVSVFDTAFHFIMPKKPYIYALPMKYYDEYEIRRYGFHGTSHKYVSLHCVELMNKKVEDTKVITYHLGNGASATATSNGRSINTSMGSTPLVDVMMGARCGGVDLTIVTYIMKEIDAISNEMDDIMNMQSDMLGISGISPDVRDIEDGCKEGNPAALLTVEVYVDRVTSVIGGYHTQLGGADAIVSAGGIGEDDINMHKMICDRLLVAFGIRLDEEPNGKVRDREVPLSTVENKAAVWLTPTNEELMIARDTRRLTA